MSFRTIAKVAIIFLSTWQAASAQSQKETNMHTVQSQTEPRTRARAKAKITVQSSEADPYDQTASPALMEIRLSETFSWRYRWQITSSGFKDPTRR
jgi:hypothetical protein